MNARKSIYNILSGLLGQGIAILLGIMIPRLVIVNLGSESNGLLSSVNQMLIYLNLLESGVGTAALQSLYRPVAEKNISKINSILSAVNRFYKRIGIWDLLTVSALALLFPLFLQSDLPFSVICPVVLLSGLTQAASFVVCGTCRLLIQAEGQNYVLNNVQTFVSVFTAIGKIVLLLQGYHLAAIQTMYFAVSLSQFAFIRFYMKRRHPWLNFSAVPNHGALSQKHSVLIHQISGLIFQNTDVLILTFACGLKTVSVYTMYVMLFGMIATVISTVNSGMSFVMGQTYHTNRKKFFRLYDAFETYNMALTFSMYCTAHIFILPFLKIYTRGVTDINYIDPRLPFLFTTTYLLSNGRSAAQRVIEYAGHFQKTQKQSLIESAINIFVSLICVFRFGIYGVLLGTIAALLYRTNEMIRYASENLLGRPPWITLKKWGSYMALYLVNLAVFWNHLINQLNDYGSLIIAAGIICLIIVPEFFILGSLVDKTSFYYCRRYLQRKKQIFS